MRVEQESSTNSTTPTEPTPLDINLDGSAPTFDEHRGWSEESQTPVDIINMYLKEIGKVPLLTADEETALAKEIEQGSQASLSLKQEGNIDPERQKELERVARDGKAAENHMVKANTKLVISIAKNYRGRGVSFLDLIQEGNLGLIKAVEKFDYRRGYKLSTPTRLGGLDKGLRGRSPTRAETSGYRLRSRVN